MSQLRLNRVILALVLLELACASQLVEAGARFRGAHRYHQSWSIPSQNWWNWSNWPMVSSQSDPPATTPQDPSPPAVSTPPVQSVPQPLPSPPAAPVISAAPVTSSVPVEVLPVQSSSLAPVPVASQVPLQPLPSATVPAAPFSSIAPAPSATPLPAAPATILSNSPSFSLPPATTSSLAPAFTPVSSASLRSVLTSSVLAPAPIPTSLPPALSSSSLPPAALTTSSPAALTTSSLAPAPTATALPAAGNKTTSGCSNPRVRPEWRSLSRQQQASYISAVKCLAKMPSKLLPGGDYRRYDDFGNVHSRMRTKIHWMSLFLPWHRHFMFLYEQALRNECGYTGNLPRWDWTLDSNDMTKSPVWSSDPMVGFGSNGRNFTEVDSALDGGVVTDGAFANWDLYYPEYHQLQRNYNLPSQFKVAGRSWGSQYFDQASMSKVQSQSTYTRFAVALEGTDPASTGPSNPGPHSIIHVMVGGDVSPTSYAANEPCVHPTIIALKITADFFSRRLFYLHHTNVDYHWWRWQNAQRSSRLNAYGGPTTRGSTKDTARITDALKFLSLSADVQVKDTMDTYSAQYCYTY